MHTGVTRCPWPIQSSLLVDWVAVGSPRQHPYRDQRRFYVVRAFLQQIRTFEPATAIPENIYRPCTVVGIHIYIPKMMFAVDESGLAASKSHPFSPRHGLYADRSVSKQWPANRRSPSLLKWTM